MFLGYCLRVLVAVSILMKLYTTYLVLNNIKMLVNKKLDKKKF